MQPFEPSMYEYYIPSDYDRSDPAGNLVDPSIGTPIRDIEWIGGWVRGPDGTAFRDIPGFNGLPHHLVTSELQSASDSQQYLLAQNALLLLLDD